MLMKPFQKSFLLITVLISAIITTSCQPKTKTESEQKNNYNTGDSMKVVTENPAITEFRTFVNTLDSADANSALLATDKYKSMFTGKSQGLCDTAFVIFHNLMDTLLISQNEKILIDTADYQSFINGKKVSRKISDYYNSLLKKGFMVKQTDGTLYIDLNYDFIFVNFLPFVSEPMNLYLTEMKLENIEGFAQGDTINILPEKHVERVIWYENFIAKYPNFVMIENCKNYRKAYFTYLLNGYNNTTLYTNAETNELSPYFTKAYEFLITQYPNSETTAQTQPYYQAIQQKQMSTVNDILKKYVIQGLIYSLK